MATLLYLNPCPIIGLHREKRFFARLDVHFPVMLHFFPTTELFLSKIRLLSAPGRSEGNIPAFHGKIRHSYH